MIPILALVGLAAIRLVEAGQSIIRAQEALKYAEVGRAAAELGQHLQTERTLAALLLTADAKQQSEAERAYQAQQDKTDEKAEKYAAERKELQSVRPNLRRLLGQIDDQLDGLGKLRSAVLRRDAIPLSSAIFRYRIAIANLLAYRESLTHLAGNAETADLARASAALAAYTEYNSEEQVVGILLLSTDRPTPAQKEAFLATIAGQTESLRAFANAVDDAHESELQRIVAGRGVGNDAAATVRLEAPLNKKTSAEVQAAVQNASKYESDLRRSEPGTKATLAGGGGAKDWAEAMRVRVALTREVEEQLDAEFQAGLQKQNADLVRQLIAQLLVVLLVLFFAALIALLIARSMARSLRRLRAGALSVAYESLPQSVARLRDPETLGELSPDQVAAGVRDPVQVRGRDEIGQVSQAFNVVHREAVRIAAEQAALRANVATMFINLARRSQVLVDRLIGHLDRLERGEEDPDRLAELFHLDHLATRMRRNDENLLVLAGADSTRVQRDPAPLSDVLRASQSEVEQYTRIEFGIVDGDVEVAPHAVNDAVHLLAELFDNATSFSPPDTVVVVDARRAGDRVILQIEDRGIGVSSEQLAELNARLANPPLVDVAVSRMMGLVVVGRLAARHGIRVELRLARDRGTIADVILPAGALILPQRAGRQQALGLPQARSPLALEGTGSAPSPPTAAAAPHGAWQSQPADTWPESWPEPAGGWPETSGASDGARRGQAPGPTQLPTGMGTQPVGRTDAGPAATGVPPMGRNGSTDRQLPRRRPGEVLGSVEALQPGGGWPAAGHPEGGQPPGEGVFGRQPAAEPTQRAQPGPPDLGSPSPAEQAGPAQQPGGAGFAGAGQPTPGLGSPTPNGGSGDAAGATGGSGPTATGATVTGRSAVAGAAKPESDDPSPVPANVDDTMELPIFREVESAWFRTKQPGPAAGESAKSERPTPAPGRRTKGKAAREERGTATAPSPRAASDGDGAAPGAEWRTAADDGWRAASAAAAPSGTGTTDSGLPKRVPMAQLVPGGVETNATPSKSRSPDAVRGLLSAYHRGVQRGRQSSVRSSTDEGQGKEQP